VSIERIRAQIWFGIPKMAIERIRIEHHLSLIAFLMVKVISDAIREAVRKAITVRMVKVDGGIARPDSTPTCLAHLIIDDHAYVAYPWTAVGCWARAHAVRSVRLPQSEVIRGHQRSSEVIRGHHAVRSVRLPQSEVIRGHQRSSEVITLYDPSACRNQRSSEVIRGHQRSSEVIRGHQRSSEAIRGHQRPSEVIRGH